MIKIKPLEDLIVAILLANGDIRKTDYGRELHFSLQGRKQSVIMSYIKRFDLTTQVEYDVNSNKGYVCPSLNLERILRDWTHDSSVHSLNPDKLRLSTYFLWIGLFAFKKEDNVFIESTLGLQQKKTLCYLFNEMIVEVKLRPSEKQFQIKPFYHLIFLSIKEKRPIEESGELHYLLPDTERERMYLLITKWEEESSNRAYL